MPAKPLQVPSSKAATAAAVQAGAAEQLAEFVALDDVDLEAVHLVNWEEQIDWAPGSPSRSAESTLTIGELSCASATPWHFGGLTLLPLSTAALLCDVAISVSLLHIAQRGALTVSPPLDSDFEGLRDWTYVRTVVSGGWGGRRHTLNRLM